jgi:hypothetical protein
MNEREKQMGYLLGTGSDSHADMLGDGLDGYVGDGLEGYVGGHRQSGHQMMLQPLPIPETSFTASQTQDVQAFPQRGFKPHRLVIPSTLGPNFKVNDLKVGQETQYVASGTVYGECFSEVAVSVILKGTRASLGNNIVLNVTNRDAVNTQVFSALLLGFTETT